MKVLLIDNGSKLVDKLDGIIPSHEKTVKKWTEVSDLDFNDFDMFILSGSKNHSVEYQHENFKNEMDLILSSDKPVIGICFGCELIAYSFGGKLKELKERHEGIREIEIIDKEFFNKSKISVYEHHRWIIDILPEEFNILGKSDDGPEAIKHTEKQIFGLQFHPENFVNETDGEEVFLNLLSKIKV